MYHHIYFYIIIDLPLPTPPQKQTCSKMVMYNMNKFHHVANAILPPLENTHEFQNSQACISNVVRGEKNP